VLCALKGQYIPAQWHRLGENDANRPLRPERAIYIHVCTGFEIRLAYKIMAKIITRAGFKPRPCNVRLCGLDLGAKNDPLLRTLIRYFFDFAYPSGWIWIDKIEAGRI
jgi:hypothetical protein